MGRLRLTDWWDKLFAIGILLKGLDGVLELAAGTLLLFVAPERIHAFAVILTQPELAEDPHSWVATHILNGTSALSHGTVLFAAIYLLLHGVVKVVLVVALLMNRLWAYPWMIVVLALFTAYQIYQILTSPSIGLLVLTVLDVLVIILTVHEYGRQREHRRRREVMP